MKVNLEKVFRYNKNCYGWIWKVGNNKYEYQNDNDLGLCNEELDFDVRVVRKLKCGKGYVYQIVCAGCPENGLNLKTTLALIHECHQNTDPLTEEENLICKNYWNQFWTS